MKQQQNGEDINKENIQNFVSIQQLINPNLLSNKKSGKKNNFGNTLVNNNNILF